MNFLDFVYPIPEHCGNKCQLDTMYCCSWIEDKTDYKHDWVSAFFLMCWPKAKSNRWKHTFSISYHRKIQRNVLKKKATKEKWNDGKCGRNEFYIIMYICSNRMGKRPDDENESKTTTEYLYRHEILTWDSRVINFFFSSLLFLLSFVFFILLCLFFVVIVRLAYREIVEHTNGCDCVCVCAGYAYGVYSISSLIYLPSDSLHCHHSYAVRSHFESM